MRRALSICACWCWLLMLHAPASNAQGMPQNADQDFVCMVTEIDDATVGKCPSNKLIFYSPKEYGNEQIPIIFIAAYCNTNHPVFYNKTGVVCLKAEKMDRLKPVQP